MQRFLRQYELLRELGSGHYGQVWLATGETPARGTLPGKRRVVAVKTLRGSDPDAARLLEQEFALLEQVKHRSIVRVYEYLADEQAVVMEYVHGVTLRTMLDVCAQRREQVFTEAALEIACELADALYQAWTTPGDNGERLQLVHRDLKPENVMLTPQGEVKILDFGLARVDNADFARDDRSRIKGTPVYMAPEQARGEEIDHRTDLFALGLILFELLTGRAAYTVPSGVPDPVATLLAAIEAGDMGDAVRELESRLPGAGPIVARLLQARPRNRYAHGHDALVDLRRQLYKDRGAYLKEFCDFFFGSLHRMPPLPTADGPHEGSGAKPMSSNESGRKSIEERLRERAAGGAAPPPDEAPAPRAPVPVRRSAAPLAPQADAPPPVRTASPPMAPRAPAPEAPASAPRITARTPSAARPAPATQDDPIVPPSVKGAPRAAPKAPHPGPKPMVGARSPDETGMLQMMPLGDDEDSREAAGDPTATSFFAIPAPKTERPKTPVAAPVTPPPAAGPPASAGPGAFQPPPFQPTMSPPPMGGPGGGFAPGGGGGFAPGGGFAQGPVAGYGGAAGGTPFQVSGSVPTQSQAAESRVQSVRVYAILLGVFALACVAVLVSIALFVFRPKEEPEPETVAVVESKPPKPAPVEKDTGEVKDPVPAAPVKAATPKPRASSGGGGGAPAAPRPAPVGAKATLTVNWTGAVVPGQVEVTCPSGLRERRAVNGGTATVPDVPTGEDCTMFAKGGVTSTPARVRGGKSYSCTITGTTTSCR